MAAFPEVLALCHECTDNAHSSPSRTLLIKTDRVHQRSFIKGFSTENVQHLQNNNLEIVIYHLIGQILYKCLDLQNVHYISVVKRKSGNDVLWNICNDADVTELNIENWTKAWKDLYNQGNTPSLSFYTKEKAKPTFSTLQFGGSSSSSETLNENTSNNASSSSSSSPSFITPPHQTTSIPPLSSSITSSYGLEALKEKRKKTGIFSPNEKRLIFKPKTKLWKEFSEKTNIKVSLSHFYKLTTNFSKAKMDTDLCGIAFVNTINNNLSTEHITTLHDLINFFENNMNTSTSASSTSQSNIFSTSSSNSSSSSTFVNNSDHERYFEEYVPSQQISWPSLSVPDMKDNLYFERKGSFVSASAVGYLPQRSLVSLESSTMKEKIK
ncbi:uncharacterized protein MONOS_12762 [Monocercomonoides exilis]|uniref:uncharacterized protein n=1 Tax=Monocercomonoides exilis TaxID=2049356 RepID=UPI0035597800|nr:hypothetical protein MONOS_12762 [Monocercomonoides exilis]|eukprot:MONOS_12762.1-p1 / transcript=MONOS_12762.1 / gene=MONOS_12762 / organism=Monocercomonoides_exilis_PA203 / gene_product=unspecified product / transcript_product=unspecified product / location=Mono_scaffold00730:6687-8402(-) / protein_length=382 / sequence_SO=supercontig / SO=protein_coding / is_pseudo=false